MQRYEKYTTWRNATNIITCFALYYSTLAFIGFAPLLLPYSSPFSCHLVTYALNTTWSPCASGKLITVIIQSETGAEIFQRHCSLNCKYVIMLHSRDDAKLLMHLRSLYRQFLGTILLPARYCMATLTLLPNDNSRFHSWNILGNYIPVDLKNQWVYREKN